MAAKSQYVLVNGDAVIHRRVPSPEARRFSGGVTACGMAIASVQWQANAILFCGERCPTCCPLKAREAARADALPTREELFVADADPRARRAAERGRRRAKAERRAVAEAEAERKAKRRAKREAAKQAAAQAARPVRKKPEPPRAYRYVLVNSGDQIHQRRPRPVADPFTGGSTACDKRIRSVQWQDDQVTFSGPRCPVCFAGLSDSQAAVWDALPTLDVLVLMDASRKYLPRARPAGSYGMRRLPGSFEGGRRR